MKGYTIFRLACLTLLWLLLCYMVVAAKGLSGPTVLVILISGGIVFVPLYKKYFNNGRS